MPIAFIISITVFITTPSKNNRAALCSAHWRRLHFRWGQRSGFRGLGLVGRHLYGEQEEQQRQLEGNLELSKSKVTTASSLQNIQLKGPEETGKENPTGPLLNGPCSAHFPCECRLQWAFKQKEIWRWVERGQDCSFDLGRRLWYLRHVPSSGSAVLMPNEFLAVPARCESRNGHTSPSLCTL